MMSLFRHIAAAVLLTCVSLLSVHAQGKGYAHEVSAGMRSSYILPTNGEERTSRWGDVYFIGNEYIITDKNLNPIDPNKFMSVMKKIIVDK